MVSKTKQVANKQQNKGGVTKKPEFKPQQNKGGNKNGSVAKNQNNQKVQQKKVAAAPVVPQKANKKQPAKVVKKEESEESDDDDDDDDDDEDEDDDDEDEDDSDLEDAGDSDDDDEDDNEDEGESEEEVKPAKVAKKETPVKKEALVAKKVEEPVVQTPRNKDADSRTLFVKNLPPNTTEEELKALSADITELRIKAAKKPNGKNKALGKAFQFAYLEFKDDATCVANYKSLQHKKIRDKEIVVDYVDARSAYTKKEEKKTS
jgi:RNA recognition motif-containing protein